MSEQLFQEKIAGSRHSRYLLSLWAAFSALISYFICRALAILGLNEDVTRNVIARDIHITNFVGRRAQIILLFFAVFLGMSVFFFLIKHDRQNGVIDALFVLLCFSMHSEFSQLQAGGITFNDRTFTVYTIGLLSISCWLFGNLIRVLPNNNRQFSALGRLLREKRLTILPFTLLFFNFYFFGRHGNDTFSLLFNERVRGRSKEFNIEFVELSHISDMSTMRKHINYLQRHHTHTVINDFGNGYACLAMWADLLINKIKLDKVFLDKTRTAEGRELHSVVVTLLHQIYKTFVAEGVGSRLQLPFVKSSQNRNRSEEGR